jgi:hypothetical protein
MVSHTSSCAAQMCTDLGFGHYTNNMILDEKDIQKKEKWGRRK